MVGVSIFGVAGGAALTHYSQVETLGLRSKSSNFGAHRSADAKWRKMRLSGNLISQKWFIKSFRKSKFPHKSVNSSFIITDTENK